MQQKGTKVKQDLTWLSEKIDPVAIVPEMKIWLYW